jgi:hypothetical protein
MCSKRDRFRAISDPIGHKRTQAGPAPFSDNPKPQCTGGGRFLSRAPSRSIGAQMEAEASTFGAHFGQNVRESGPVPLRAHFCPNVRETDAPRRVASALSVQSCLKSAQPRVVESTASPNCFRSAPSSCGSGPQIFRENRLQDRIPVLSVQSVVFFSKLFCNHIAFLRALSAPNVAIANWRVRFG